MSGSGADGAPQETKAQSPPRHRLWGGAFGAGTAPEMDAFNVLTRTHHQQKSVSILFTDGHVTATANRNERFTVDSRNYAELRDSFNKILKVFEQADTAP